MVDAEVVGKSFHPNDDDDDMHWIRYRRFVAVKWWMLRL
jgi:hypothetical protein